MKTLFLFAFLAITGCAMAQRSSLVDEAVDAVRRGVQQVKSVPGAFKRGLVSRYYDSRSSTLKGAIVWERTQTGWPEVPGYTLA